MSKSALLITAKTVDIIDEFTEEPTDIRVEVRTDRDWTDMPGFSLSNVGFDDEKFKAGLKQLRELLKFENVRAVRWTESLRTEIVRVDT